MAGLQELGGQEVDVAVQMDDEVEDEEVDEGPPCHTFPVEALEDCRNSAVGGGDLLQGRRDALPGYAAELVPGRGSALDV